jgi:pimeloyl-ACP methyl ester carboxylesterase/DNA-binding winged helix-turn-helix (wHTH) protein/class 3 adenylate cyclase
MELGELNIYSFGGFEINGGERILRGASDTIALPPKVFDTLLMLVMNAGRVLSKERMLDEIWEGSFVEENNLAQNISVLRKVLGESTHTKFIETVPKFGYRFVAPVSQVSPDVTTETSQISRARVYLTDMPNDAVAIPQQPLTGPDVDRQLKASFEPETHYVLSGDANIAYQIVGDGPIDIVFVMGWVSHLEYFWKEPHFASFLERLASFSRLILFDKRGTGLSDRVPNDLLPTLEQRMEDVHAVMDAVGSEQAVLIGVSEGGPMCSLFAATYPDRTSALVMIGTYAKRIRDDDYPWAPTEEQREAFFETMRRDWGKPVGIVERAPSLADDPDFRDWWGTYLRMGASPGAAVALTKMNAEIDVRDVLPSIRVPTLVIHRSGDMCLKVEEGRYVASRIPNAEYVELGGIDHLPFVGDQDEILDEIQRFVAEFRSSGKYDRVLATVLNVKIVDHAEEIKRRGPDDWRSLFDRSSEYIRRKLELYRGKQIAYDENGMLAVFDGPARAIRCASVITEAAGKMGVQVRTSLHTGECDVIDGVYSGIAVELAKLIADESRDGHIVVSRTVKDLVAGSGLTFNELGVKSFESIDGEWRLFSVNT